MKASAILLVLLGVALIAGCTKAPVIEQTISGNSAGSASLQQDVLDLDREISDINLDITADPALEDSDFDLGLG